MSIKASAYIYTFQMIYSLENITNKIIYLYMKFDGGNKTSLAMWIQKIGWIIPITESIIRNVSKTSLKISKRNPIYNYECMKDK